MSDDANGWPRVIRELRILRDHAIAIGFFGETNSRLLTVVRANEYGARIHPLNGQWLTIPSKHVPKGHDGLPMRARDMNDIFKLKGKNVLVRSDGNGNLTVMYYLVKEVIIPRRPFIRTAMITNRAKYRELIMEGIDKIAFDDGTAAELLNRLGLTAVNDIRRSSVRWSAPANAPVTKENKGSGNPLVDTGNLQKSVTYRIIGGL